MLGFCCDVNGKVFALNILAKIGLGTFVIFGVLSGGYYVMDLRANEAARLAIETSKKILKPAYHLAPLILEL